MTQTRRYSELDVFTPQPLLGNPLAVVHDGRGLSDAQMAAFARWTNLSETTFLLPPTRPEADYMVRIFTPERELPFAGHPTLGTAWVLGPGRWTQRSPGMTVEVEVTGSGATFAQPDPKITEVYPEDAAAALGLLETDASVAFLIDAGGTKHVLVPTDHSLTSLRFNRERLVSVGRSHGAVGVAAMRATGKAAVHVRLIVPGDNTFEDPGTGSASGAVGLIARTRWGLDEDIVISQGDEIGRPCRIRVHAEPGNVRVGGDVAACASGRLLLQSE